MKVANELAKFIVQTGLGSVPTSVLKRTKFSFIDCLGTTLAGSCEPAAHKLVRYIERIGGNPVASLVGHKIKTSTYNAAMANGTMGHILDYDDMSSSLIGHPSVPILPTVLALGEENKISGKDALLAFILGIEVECKIGRGIIPKHYENGWHPTSTIGIFGATAAAAKILGLSQEEVVCAFGIAGSESSGLRENFGTMVKPFHAGRASAKGILAALLAKEGFTSATDIFGGEWGFCRVMTGECGEERIIDTLGNPFEIENPGITIKPYPTCGATHPAIDAVISLAKYYDLRADDVEKIDCGTVPIAKDVLIYPKPSTPLEGKFSMPYCLARALSERKVELSQFTDDKINEPMIRGIIDKVNMYIAPEMAALGYRGTFNAKVKIVLKNGRKYERTVDHARGDPANPFSEDELMAKYSDCAALALHPEQIEKSRKMVLDLEQLPDITTLMDIIRT